MDAGWHKATQYGTHCGACCTAGVYGTLYDRLWGRFLRLYGSAVPGAWRQRLEAAWTAVQSRWVLWETQGGTCCTCWPAGRP